MKTNIEKLVKISVQGSVNHPKLRFPGHRVGHDGIGRTVPAVAGITYTQFIGDSCIGLVGDHVEPGVSSKNPNPDDNAAYNTLACVGNEAIVISGDAKGRKGLVTGKHGGADHVMLAFDAETLDLLTCNDQFLVKGFGLGLALSDYPDVHTMNLSPDLLEKWGIVENGDGTLNVPVAAIVPAYLMGSGLGSTTSFSGDYDIMMHDANKVKEFNLDELRFGDLVYIQDHKSMFGPDYLEGASTIGVIVHSDSFSSGHGPGVCVLLTSDRPILKPVLSKTANLKDIYHFNK
ncbi:MAG: DUF4438 domain-containing protein [Erysipelotrichaceae bacterium]